MKMYLRGLIAAALWTGVPTAVVTLAPESASAMQNIKCVVVDRERVSTFEAAAEKLRPVLKRAMAEAGEGRPLSEKVITRLGELGRMAGKLGKEMQHPALKMELMNRAADLSGIPERMRGLPEAPAQLKHLASLSTVRVVMEGEKAQSEKKKPGGVMALLGPVLAK